MGCQAPRDLNGDDFGVPELKEKNKKLKRELDRVTRLLCALCTRAENEGVVSISIFEKIKGMRTWFAQHKRADARRKRLEEKKRREALTQKATRRDFEAQELERVLGGLSPDDRRIVEKRLRRTSAKKK